MPRLNHVKSARKDNPVVKKGESYYWWKFRFGGKHYSKERPARSRLTQSSFNAWLWDLEDLFIPKLLKSVDSLESDIQDLVTSIEDQHAELEDSFGNIPEQLQDSSPAGEILRERMDALEAWINELEGLEYEPDEDFNDEEKQEWLDDFKDQLPMYEG